MLHTFQGYSPKFTENNKIWQKRIINFGLNSHLGRSKAVYAHVFGNLECTQLKPNNSTTQLGLCTKYATNPKIFL